MEFSIKLFIYQIINFSILMVILSILFNKFIRPFMHKRTNEIKASFEQIEVQKKEVEALKQQYTDQVVEMRQRVKAEIDKAIEEGSRMRDEILTKTERDALVLLDKAREEIENQRHKTMAAMQNEVAKLTMLATTALIKKQMDDATSRKIVEEFIGELNAQQPQK
jgi:F-type H+-transporting ATPase subunit b